MTFSLPCNKTLLVIAYLMTAPAFAQSPAVDQEINTITQDLRCLTCPNENIAESSSPMALDVKNYIHERLLAGDNKDAILKVLTQRYGEELYYKPVWANHTIFLWLTPILALFTGGLLLFRIFRKPTP